MASIQWAAMTVRPDHRTGEQILSVPVELAGHAGWVFGDGLGAVMNALRDAQLKVDMRLKVADPGGTSVLTIQVPKVAEALDRMAWRLNALADDAGVEGRARERAHLAAVEEVERFKRSLGSRRAA